MEFERAVDEASTAHLDTSTGQIILEFEEEKTELVSGSEETGKFATVTVDEQILTLFSILEDSINVVEELDDTSIENIRERLGDKREI